MHMGQPRKVERACLLVVDGVGRVEDHGVLEHGVHVIAQRGPAAEIGAPLVPPPHRREIHRPRDHPAVPRRLLTQHTKVSQCSKVRRVSGAAEPFPEPTAWQSLSSVQQACSSMQVVRTISSVTGSRKMPYRSFFCIRWMTRVTSAGVGATSGAFSRLGGSGPGQASSRQHPC